jgi:hypothetical protein
MQQAIFQGQKVSVINHDDVQAVISYNGSDRSFARTSDLEFLPSTEDAPSVTEKKPVASPAKTTGSKAKTLIDSAGSG